MEFIERFEEYLHKTNEHGWNSIKILLDDSFKDVRDNWWPEVHYLIKDYQEFKTIFKAMYWSESIQNLAHDDLCNGQFTPNLGENPTAYFFGKICIARHLEPKLLEECLVTNLAYHFDRNIVQARLCNQIKTINGM